jgi:hypothetical protein
MDASTDSREAASGMDRDERKRSKAWPRFATALAAALAALEENQFLILERQDRPWYVQFAAQGNYGIRTELVSNAYLAPQDQLSETAVRTAVSLGWQAPSGSPTESTPAKDPDGSPNFFRDWEQPVSFDTVAQLVVDTMVEVLEVHHPGQLHYKAFARGGARILLPELGPSVKPETPQQPTEPEPPPDAERIRSLLLDLVRRVTGNKDLGLDSEGDIPIRYGSGIVLIRVFGNPPIVRVFSPILGRITATDGVVEALNKLNRESTFVKWLLVNDTIIAVVELFGRPFTPDHVLSACSVLGRAADERDEALQREFGGKTFFGEYEPAKPPPSFGYL